jgi:hypothetical protein
METSKLRGFLIAFFGIIMALLSEIYALEIQFNSTDEDCGQPIVTAVHVDGHIMRARDWKDNDRRWHVNTNGELEGWHKSLKGPMSAWVHDESCHRCKHSLDQFCLPARLDYNVNGDWRAATIPVNTDDKVLCGINESNFNCKFWISQESTYKNTVSPKELSYTDCVYFYNPHKKETVYLGFGTGGRQFWHAPTWSVEESKYWKDHARKVSYELVLKTNYGRYPGLESK